MTDSYLDEYSASMSEIRNTLNSLNDYNRKPYSPTSMTSLGIPPVLTPGGHSNIMSVWDTIDTEQMGYLETSEVESVIAEYFAQSKSICRSKFDEFEREIFSVLGNGVVGHVQKLKEKCTRRLESRHEEFESNPRSYVLALAQALNLEGQGSLLRSEFCDKAPTSLFGMLKGNDDLEEAEQDNMTKLVLHLESAERKNLRLREEMQSLKQKLRELQTLSVQKSHHESHLLSGETIESLRSDKAKLLVEKETWNTLNEKLQRESRRLIQENTRLSMAQNEMSQYQKEIETWKEKYVTAERQANELRTKLTSVTMENERLNSEKDMFGFDNSNAGYGLDVRRSPRNRLNLNKSPVGITVKTVYQNDVRCWDPPTPDCYQDLLHFVKTQYDSTYYISYADADGDSVRVTSDNDCRRAFEIAKQNGWESIKFQVELRAEIEVRNQYKDLELKHRKLKKQLQKLKKRTENSTYSTLKGRAVLDNMLSAFHHKALDEEMKDPIGRRTTAGYVANEQASLWSLKDQFARNVKSDLRSGWALVQIEVDDRKAISEAIGKKEFLSLRECISQYLVKTTQKIEGATIFDLHLCYMILLREQDEQSIKQVARSLLNVISDKDILRENNISPIPGIDRITCSAGAVMYNGEEDYLRWSRKADEALEYGKYHGANQVGNWEQYHSKKTSRSRTAAKRLPGDVNQMDPYIENIVRQSLEGGATEYS